MYNLIYIQDEKERKITAMMKMGLTPPIAISPRTRQEIIKAPFHFKKTDPERKKRKTTKNQKLFLLEQLLEGRFCLGPNLVTRFRMET